MIRNKIIVAIAQEIQDQMDMYHCKTFSELKKAVSSDWGLCELTELFQSALFDMRPGVRVDVEEATIYTPQGGYHPEDALRLALAMIGEEETK